MATLILFGATGFVGRNLAIAAAGAGHRVIAVSRSGASVEGAIAHFSTASIDRIPPVSDGEVVAIHAAAQRYDAGRFDLAQSDILATNTALANLFYGFCAERGIKEARLLSSVAVYPAGLPVMDDAEPVDLNGLPHRNEAFYGWSKRFTELAAQLHADRFGIATQTFRLSNPYGPHDSIDPGAAHVLPAFVMRALGPDPEFRLKGDPEVERDFIWIGDVVQVLLRSLERRGENQTYNLCFGETVTLRRLAELAIAGSGSHKPLVTDDSFAPAAVRVRRSTSARVKQAFGIDAFTPLEQGLDATIAWYREALGHA